MPNQPPSTNTVHAELPPLTRQSAEIVVNSFATRHPAAAAALLAIVPASVFSRPIIATALTTATMALITDRHVDDATITPGNVLRWYIIACTMEKLSTGGFIVAPPSQSDASVVTDPSPPGRSIFSKIWAMLGRMVSNSTDEGRRSGTGSKIGGVSKQSESAVKAPNSLPVLASACTTSSAAGFEDLHWVEDALVEAISTLKGELGGDNHQEDDAAKDAMSHNATADDIAPVISPEDISMDEHERDDVAEDTSTVHVCAQAPIIHNKPIPVVERVPHIDGNERAKAWTPVEREIYEAQTKNHEASCTGAAMVQREARTAGGVASGSRPAPLGDVELPAGVTASEMTSILTHPAGAGTPLPGRISQLAVSANALNDYLSGNSTPKALTECCDAKLTASKQIQAARGHLRSFESMTAVGTEGSWDGSSRPAPVDHLEGAGRHFYAAYELDRNVYHAFLGMIIKEFRHGCILVARLHMVDPDIDLSLAPAAGAGDEASSHLQTSAPTLAPIPTAPSAVCAPHPVASLTPTVPTTDPVVSTVVAPMAPKAVAVPVVPKTASPVIPTVASITPEAAPVDPKAAAKAHLAAQRRRADESFAQAVRDEIALRVDRAGRRAQKAKGNGRGKGRGKGKGERKSKKRRFEQPAQLPAEVIDAARGGLLSDAEEVEDALLGEDEEKRQVVFQRDLGLAGIIRFLSNPYTRIPAEEAVDDPAHPEEEVHRVVDPSEVYNLHIDAATVSAATADHVFTVTGTTWPPSFHDFFPSIKRLSIAPASFNLQYQSPRWLIPGMHVTTPNQSPPSAAEIVQPRYEGTQPISELVFEYERVPDWWKIATYHLAYHGAATCTVVIPRSVWGSSDSPLHPVPGGDMSKWRGRETLRIVYQGEVQMLPGEGFGEETEKAWRGAYTAKSIGISVVCHAIGVMSAYRDGKEAHYLPTTEYHAKGLENVRFWVHHILTVEESIASSIVSNSDLIRHLKDRCRFVELDETMFAEAE
ncbi:hypothetical protein IAT38_002728 [Cryptococcus sp. DSM 104549]